MTRQTSRVRRWRVWLLVGLLAAVGVIVWRQLGAHRRGAQEGETRDRYATVRRGDFNIALEIDGNLDAIKHHMIRPEPRSGSRGYGLEIVELVENRSAVKTGDLLFRFSDEKHAVELDRLKLELADEQTSLKLAEQDLDMTRAGNLSTIRNANDQLRASEEALSRYEDEDARRKRADLQAAVQTARAKLAQVRTELSVARSQLSTAQMQDPGRVPELEKVVLDKSQAVDAVRDAIDLASSNLRVFKQYDHPQKMRLLQEGRTKAQMDLQRDLVTAAGNLVKDQRIIQNHRARIRQMEEELEQLIAIRKSLVVRAPSDGIVTMGDPQRRAWNQPEELKVGSQVNEGQVLASIPDLSRFLVRVDLPEEFRSRISTGLRAVLRSKAIPNLVMEGRVSLIAAMAQNVVNWDRSSPKIYPVEIATDTMDPRLMPGMTMRVEIIVEQVANVLHVPIEAIFQREGKTFARVKGAVGVEERPVTTGRSSNSFVEILSGLEEGERVALYQAGLAK
ncbi:MAG: HlyD family efflux transporter periplasmic adaptor subunit [Lentisphaerae bacterium]|nr:HlyD family efflux transporter periplasmic adaptor subunit [Lentisphaerota bacterium]